MTLVTKENTDKDAVQTLIDQTLVNFFNVSIKRAATIDPHYETLWRALAELHASGGKRIRPKIVMMSYAAFGGRDSESIVPIACAQELLHFCMLIHDDIIDRDTKRYGVDNMTGRYLNIYAPFVTDDNERLHYANSAAIIAGDLMLAGAHTLIRESTVSDEKKSIAYSKLYDSLFNVAGGELIDTESSFRPMGAIDPLKVTLYKTASYSFVGPFVIGAHLADASDADVRTLTELGTNLGIAYQLTDDLLGVFGDEAMTGKSNTGDIREGKKTYLIEQTVNSLSGDDLSIFHEKFGVHTATDKDVNLIKDLIIKSGAKTQTEQQIESYIEKTRRALDQLSLPQDSYARFNELIIKSTKRDF